MTLKTLKQTLLYSVITLCLVTCRTPSNELHIIVISMDGLSPDYYLEADNYGLQIPTLRSLMEKGVYASAMETVYPSVTYPAHASLATGVLPARHGIFANSYYFDGVKGPVVSGNNYEADPIWRIAGPLGFTTAAVFWPVTRDEPIDWLIPEVWWEEDKGNDKVRLRKEAEISTPGLIGELKEYIGPPLQKYFESDTVKTDAAIYIVQKYRPNMLFLHYSHLDYHQHMYGFGSPQAMVTLEMQDRQIGRIVSVAEEIGILEKTIFMIVSDHGHADIRWQINPGVLLTSMGLIDLDENGDVVDWKAMVIPTGGSCSIILRDKNDKSTHGQIMDMSGRLAEDSANGIKEMLLPQKIRSLGGNPDAVVMFEAKPGYAFGSRLTGPVIEPATYRSTHGYLPEMPEMKAAFIAAGPKIKNKGEIDRIRIIDLFPTIARILNLRKPDSQGNVLDIVDDGE